MAYVTAKDQRFPYADNPRMSPDADTFADEYPPIVTDAKWLRCKVTGQLYPNVPEYAERSDILEPYFGEPMVPAPSVPVPPAANTINAALAQNIELPVL